MSFEFLFQSFAIESPGGGKGVVGCLGYTNGLNIKFDKISYTRFLNHGGVRNPLWQYLSRFVFKCTTRTHTPTSHGTQNEGYWLSVTVLVVVVDGW